MQNRFAAIALAPLVALTVASCGAPTAGSVDAVRSPGSWTVLTYSIADTNLEPFMMTDLEELGEIGSQEDLNLVALVDRSEDYSDEPVLGLDNWDGGKLIEIGEGEATVLEELGDINTGDPDLLAEFIAAGIELYPADHYALVISDHGASWPGVGADGSFDNDTLSLAEIDAGISAGLAAGGVEKLDLLGFDACLMATYEVASELADVSNRLVASQELEPGHGWDYRSFGLLADDPAATVDALGSAIIDGFKAQADLEGTSVDITLSLVDLTQMDAVGDALAEFTQVLIDRAEGIGPTVGRTLAETLGFGNSPDPDQDTHMADLAIFTSEIGVNLLFASDAADEVTRAINDAVLDRVEGQATQGATGLSIYFPPQLEYFDEDYRELEHVGGWMDFLDTYYGEGDDIADDPVLADGAEITFGEDGVTIIGSFDDVTADNLSYAYIRYGVIEGDGSVTFLGEEDAELSDDGSGTATGTYDLSYLTLSDGIDTVTAYLSLYGDRDDDVVTADVPLAYYSPDGEEAGDLVLSSTIDTATGETLSATYYVFDEETGTYGEFTPEPDWIIVPVVLNVLEDGTEEWLLTSDVGLFADLEVLSYDLGALPSGTQLYLELIVVDFGGGWDSVHGIVTVP
jgi:hypothetical protein